MDLEKNRQKIESFLKKLEKLPISDLCPLIKNPKWKCGNFEKGCEEHCKSANGYMNCVHFRKWFFWNVEKMVAREIAKMEIEQKKKEAKKKL